MCMVDHRKASKQHHYITYQSNSACHNKEVSIIPDTSKWDLH